MDKNDIVSNFFEHLQDKQKYTRSEERNRQYQKLFSDDSVNKLYRYFSQQEVLLDELDNNYMQRLLSELIDNYTMFKELGNTVSVAMIKSKGNFTCCFSYENNNIVLFDRNTMKLYWMLNKALLYSDKKERREQIFLFLKIILNYISDAHKLDKYPQPSTPPHEDKNLLANLVLITEIQETFILAHEMAHIVLNKEKALRKYENGITAFLKQFGIIEQKYNIAKLCEELEADRISLDAVLQIYQNKAEEKIIFELISSAVFLLIRYHLWITVAEIEITHLEDEYYIWLIRNSHIREYISEHYKWGAPIYIIELLDYLEDTLEVAAHAAYEVLRDNKAEK